MRRLVQRAIFSSIMLLTAGCSGDHVALDRQIIPSAGSTVVPTTAPSGVVQPTTKPTSAPTPTQQPTMTPTPLPTPSGASMTISQVVTNSAGGAVTLGTSSASFSSGSLEQDANVQLAQIPVNVEQAPGENKPVGPVLRVAFFPVASRQSARRRSDASPSNASATFTFKVSSDIAARLARFAGKHSSDDPGFSAPDLTLPLMRIYSDLNSSRYIDVSPNYTVDQGTETVTFLTSGNLALFPVNSAIELFLIQVTNGNKDCGLQGHFAPGLRYYDPTSKTWSATAPSNSVAPTHTLLLLHGIMSCVEGTFSSKLVEQYRVDGGYDQIVGYDYDWIESPDQVAPDIAAAVNILNPTKLDVFAHSYGTVNAMAMIPSLTIGQVDNLVLYAGPLNGSYLSAPVFYQTLIANAAIYPNLAIFSKLTVPILQNASAIFAPNNVQLQQIKANLVASKKVLRVVKVAGTIPTFNGIDLSAVYTKITGQPAPVSDGIVTTTSADDASVVGTQPSATLDQNDVIDGLTDNRDFPQNHTSLLTSTTGQQQTEPFISKDLAFSIPSFDPDTYHYADKGAQVFLKGVGSRAHFYLDSIFDITQYSVANFSSSYMTENPPVVTFNDYSTNDIPLTFTVSQPPPGPPTVTSGSVDPTVSATLNSTDISGNVHPYNANFYILPDCVSCSTISSSTSHLLQQMQISPRKVRAGAPWMLRSRRSRR